MKIAVLDYNNASVDIIEVPYIEIKNTYGGVEEFLTERCGYNIGEIEYMSDVQNVDNFLTPMSFDE